METLPLPKKSSSDREKSELEAKRWWVEDLDREGKVDEEKLRHWSSAKELGLLQAVNPDLVTAPFIKYLLFQALS